MIHPAPAAYAKLPDHGGSGDSGGELEPGNIIREQFRRACAHFTNVESGLVDFMRLDRRSTAPTPTFGLRTHAQTPGPWPGSSILRTEP